MGEVQLVGQGEGFLASHVYRAYEKYGVTLEEGKIVVVEGVVSHRDGETRMTVSMVRAIDRAIAELAEEVTWLIDPVHEDAEQFTKDLFALGDRGEGGTLIRLGFAREGEEDGLVVETDPRFSMRLTPACFKEWRTREPVKGARVVMRPPEPPPERPWAKKD